MSHTSRRASTHAGKRAGKHAGKIRLTALLSTIPMALAGAAGIVLAGSSPAAALDASAEAEPVATREASAVTTQETSAATAREAKTVTATAEDRAGLRVTIYNDGFAVLSDRRRVELPAGRSRLVFEDVAGTLQPETALLTLRGRGDAEIGETEVLALTFDFDLLDPDSLLEGFVGHEVVLVFREEGKGGTVLRREPATLVTTRGGGVWRMGGRLVVSPPYAWLEFDPEQAPELRAEPALVWDLESGGGEAIAAVAYLASGIGWSADYVLSVPRLAAEESGAGTLAGRVTVDNDTGMDLPGAEVELVAGDVRRVSGGEEPVRGRIVAMQAEARMGEEAEPVGPAGAYHLYRLDEPVDVGDRQRKQVSLLEGERLELRRAYRVESSTSYYRRRMRQTVDLPVQLRLQFRNSETAGPGVPLPGGVVRVYEEAADGTARFLGEDRIGHTPVDEEVTLTIGTAFDVVAERRQTDFQRLSDEVQEAAFEVVLRNHAASGVTVEVVERFGGEWELLSSSHEPRREDAFTAVFPVPVPAGGESTLTFRVRVTSR